MERLIVRPLGHQPGGDPGEHGGGEEVGEQGPQGSVALPLSQTPKMWRVTDPNPPPTKMAASTMGVRGFMGLDLGVTMRVEGAGTG